jgi:hypothetical protein
MRRRTLVPSAVLAVVALGAGVASASAAPAARSAGSTTAHTAVTTTTTAAAAHVTVTPTGSGPGDAEVCTAFGVNIDNQLGHLVDDVGAGDWAGAAGQVEAVSNLVGMATDAGCAIS